MRFHGVAASSTQGVAASSTGGSYLLEREEEERVRAARVFVHRCGGVALARLTRLQHRQRVGEAAQRQLPRPLQHKGSGAAPARVARLDAAAAHQVGHLDTYGCSLGTWGCSLDAWRRGLWGRHGTSSL